MTDFIIGMWAFVAALLSGTLGEYLIHRFILHAPHRTYITHRHRLHHKANEADTVWGDFRDFLWGAVPICWFGFLHSFSAGVGFLCGSVVYVFFLALVHKLSHACPKRVFWMANNSHMLHHQQTPRRNFGIVTRFWDVVFGTYVNPSQNHVK